MSRKIPNSYCNKCNSFSYKFSNDTCSNKLYDGSLCKAALFGILDNEIKDCTACKGEGSINRKKCSLCGGTGFEYVPQKNS